MYKMPCTEMERTVTTDEYTQQGYTGDHTLSLRFIYDSEAYMQIQNREAYDKETLLSQIGGFIGKKSSKLKHFQIHRVSICCIFDN